MSETNPSFVLHSPGKTSFENRAVPELRSPDDVLVQVKYTGICGSDVHYWTDGTIGKLAMREPMVLGHESAGIVVDVGSSVKSLTPGDNVALEPGIPCRRCDLCKAGHYNQCADMRFAATPPCDGTLAKYYVLPEDFCYKLPEPQTITDERNPHQHQHGVSLEEGALIEPLSVAVHLIRRADVTPGNSIVVFGAGPIGLLSCAVARAFGATIIVAVDVNAERLAFATDYAATHSYNPSTSSGNGNSNGNTNSDNIGKEDNEDARSASKLLLASGIDTLGADKAVDASGAASCIRTAIYCLRPGGTFVQAGMGNPTIPFPITEMCQKELDVKGSFRYGAGDYQLAVNLIATGKVDVKKLISGKVAFREAEEAFKKVRDRKGGIKILIEGPE